jgi:hypothetical protein
MSQSLTLPWSSFLDPSGMGSLQWLAETRSWPFFHAGVMLFYDQYLFSQKDITLFYQQRSI